MQIQANPLTETRTQAQAQSPFRAHQAQTCLDLPPSCRIVVVAIARRRIHFHVISYLEVAVRDFSSVLIVRDETQHFTVVLRY